MTSDWVYIAKQRRKCVCVWGGGGVCFSRSPNECSRSQNMNCLNRCDFYSRTTKYFQFNRTEIIV